MFTFFSINNISRYIFIAFAFTCIFIILKISLGDKEYKEYEGIDASGEMILARLNRAMAELSALKAQNDELHALIQSYIPFEDRPVGDFIPKHQVKALQANEDKHSHDKLDTIDSIDSDFEFSRRKLKGDINELWYFLRHNLNQSDVLFAEELKNSLLYDMEIISHRDELNRRKQLGDLSKYIQTKLSELQNPEDCRKARKLICNLNKGCGFGCQIHHLVYCTIVSMATQRTLVLNSKNWRYVRAGHARVPRARSMWDLAFKPLSNSCLEETGHPRSHWVGSIENEHVQVLELPIIDSLRPRPPYLPLSIPQEISEKLATLHGNPIVWFIGQILYFLLKPSTDVEQYLGQRKKVLGFSAFQHIVGVHVRRTDKINTEASFHPLHEYMKHVEEYFRKLELFYQRKNKKSTKIERVVYLATDDVAVWKKEVPSFIKKGYRFVGDSDISSTASVGRRYSFDSLKNIILDIWLLSESDHLICTFSSQVCRLAYELMQSKNPEVDRSSDYYSLDDIYYYGGQGEHNQVVVLDHIPLNNSEINLRIGNIIGIAGNHWNGYSKGLNRATQENGLYPGFKTIEKIDTAKFELFEDE